MMKYFFKIDDNFVVVDSVVANVPESKLGQEFISEDLGLSGTWIERNPESDNANNSIAGVGYIYDPDKDVFLVEQPFPSWTLDENYEWQPPVPKPAKEEGELPYYWNEENLSWEKSS